MVMVGAVTEKSRFSATEVLLLSLIRMRVTNTAGCKTHAIITTEIQYTQGPYRNTAGAGSQIRVTAYLA